MKAMHVSGATVEEIAERVPCWVDESGWSEESIEVHLGVACTSQHEFHEADGLIWQRNTVPASAHATSPKRTKTRSATLVRRGGTLKLLKFQQKFIANALRPEVKTAALSLPRGNGKSTLAGHLVARALTPDDALFHRGTESIIVASSLEQGRIVYKAARDIMRENLGSRSAGR